MRTGLAIVLGVAGLASLGLAYLVADANHAFGGCRVTIANQEHDAQRWNLTFAGATRSGVLAPSAQVTLKVCTFGPRDAAEAVISTATSSARVAMDPFCSDPVVELQDEGMLVEARTCS